ncbi:glycosyltransferase family 2 protein [Aeromonas salmonicida]|uniref:Glycosyl transferase family 2 n=1 Tax=Aeromonas salmonicida TaxID=645 RepID=A0AAX1PJY3_AERSA|nr:glycosyltransferase family 2 protein [Aeromonas salmonicida]RAJ04891.1 glycosyl transferase family 2 [Aeromonas salmonicida]
MIFTHHQKITVITVVYNAKDSIERTIKSVVDQVDCDLEYIIIDGASTDGTVDIIEAYKQNLSYWVSEKDDGVYEAMNKGISASTGDWIIFMNAGDYFCEPNTVSQVIPYLTQDNDVVSGDIYLWEEGERVYVHAKGLDKAMDGMFCFHQSMFTRAEICKKYKFDTSFKIAGDYDFALKCLMNGARFKYLSFPIADFFSGGLSYKYLMKAKIEDMFIQSKYMDPIEGILNTPSYTTLKKMDYNNNYYFSTLFNEMTKQLSGIFSTRRRIVLYGYGQIGQFIYSFYQSHVSLVVDMGAQIRSTFDFVVHPSTLKECDCDLVLISVLGREQEIAEYLKKECDIDAEQIVTLSL